jgi:DNA uptake protein ComE-like DNA-binding protein
MAQRHWLDPLARRLLQATGQIPAPAARPAAPEPSPPAAPSAPADSVELELLSLKLRQNPGLRLRDAAEVRGAAALGWRLDVNRATRADWLRLPGIQAHHVDLLLRLQAGGVQLSGPDDLQRLLELPAPAVAAWLPLLEFRWYGEPPAAPPEARLDLNQARASELELLGLSPERCQRLLRERSRAPFSDLADLQQRLQLPPDLVEGWIGKVRFGTGPVGPMLPGAPRTDAPRR